MPKGKKEQKSESKSSNSDSSSSKSEESTPQKTSRSSDKKYNLDEVDVSNIEVTDFFEDGQQPTAFVNYGSSGDKLFVKCKKIKLVQGGVPRLSKEGDNQYIKSDDDRKYMKIPIDPSQPSSVELGKFVEKLDEKFGSEEMRIKLFGKKFANNYMYSPAIKVPQNNDEEEEEDSDDGKKSKKNKKTTGKQKVKKDVRMNVIRMNFHFTKDENSKDSKIVGTRLIRVGSDGCYDVPVKTMTDVFDEIPWKSDIQIIFQVFKVWKTKNKIQGNKLYGIGFKIIVIRYTPSSGSSMNQIKTMDFSSEEEKSPVKAGKKSESKNNNKSSKGNDDDSDESEPKSKNKSKNDKKGKKSDNSDDDDNKNKNKSKDKGKDNKSSKEKTKGKNKNSDSNNNSNNNSNSDDEPKNKSKNKGKNNKNSDDSTEKSNDKSSDDGKKSKDKGKKSKGKNKEKSDNDSDENQKKSKDKGKSKNKDPVSEEKPIIIKKKK